jgi:hypothetical protein
MLELRELAIFMAPLAVMFWASGRLAPALEHIGTRLRFSDGLPGIVTAPGTRHWALMHRKFARHSRSCFQISTKLVSG